jgi:hypothetical protein
VKGSGPIAFAILLAAGCGDRLVEGGYYGDATLRLHGVIGSALGDPSHAQVGAAWLGYSGLVDPTSGIDTAVLPITSVQFPTNFECDVLHAPPSAGRYAAHGGGIIPASIRLARLLLIDDVDQDGRFTLDDAAHVVPPDQLLATSDDHALLFVQQPPDHPAALDGADALLTNWEAADANYHVVELDTTVAKPDLSGRVVANDTHVFFTAPVAGAAF